MLLVVFFIVDLTGEILSNLNDGFSVKFSLACDLSLNKIIVLKFLHVEVFRTVTFERTVATYRPLKQVSLTFKFIERRLLI